MEETSMSSSSPATTSLRSLCSASSATVKVSVMSCWRLRFIPRKHFIWDLARRPRKAICPRQTAGAINASSRSLPTRSSRKQEEQRLPAGSMGKAFPAQIGILSNAVRMQIYSAIISHYLTGYSTEKDACRELPLRDAADCKHLTDRHYASGMLVWKT